MSEVKRGGSVARWRRRAALGALAASLAFVPATVAAQDGHDHAGHGHAGHEHAGHGHAEHGRAGHGAAASHGEHGAHGAHHGPEPINWATFGGTRRNAAGQQVTNPPPLLSAVINFLLLAGILFLVVKRVMNPSLATRRATIEAELTEAKRLREEAAAMHQEYSERLEKMDAEFASLRDELRAAGEGEAKRIVDEANARAERMTREGEAAIAQEVRALRDELRREAVESAMRGAEEAVRKAIGAADQTRLADNFLTDLERQAAQGSGAQA